MNEETGMFSHFLFFKKMESKIKTPNISITHNKN